jgi:hypothetical protein
MISGRSAASSSRALVSSIMVSSVGSAECCVQYAFWARGGGGASGSVGSCRVTPPHNVQARTRACPVLVRDFRGPFASAQQLRGRAAPSQIAAPRRRVQVLQPLAQLQPAADGRTMTSRSSAGGCWAPLGASDAAQAAEAAGGAMAALSISALARAHASARARFTGSGRARRLCAPRGGTRNLEAQPLAL